MDGPESGPGPQVGDRLTLRPTQLAFGGDTIARHDGLAIFLPFAAIGDEIVAEIVDRKPRHARARIVTIVTPSPDREEPPCPYFGTCGGCRYQHLTYSAELVAKEEQVRESLRRLGGRPDAPVLPIIPSPQPYEYRNRLTVHAVHGVAGFRGIDPRKLVGIERCELAMDEVNACLAELQARHPQDGHYSLRHPDIPPAAFFQVNHYLLDTLSDAVAQALAHANGGKLPTNIVEGYAGTGLLTEALAGEGRTVTMIESDARSLRDARRLAKQVTGIDIIEGRTEDLLTPLLPGAGGVVLDPPREGLPSPVLKDLIAHPVPALVYVSCHPPALARDAKRLGEAYDLVAVQPVDLFPRTAQIECISSWRKR